MATRAASRRPEAGSATTGRSPRRRTQMSAPAAIVAVTADEDNQAMRREVTTATELRTIVGEPDHYVASKVKDRLSPVQCDWLAHSPLVFVATTDAQGRVDVSPKGDPPGFVHVVDDRTIVIPDRPGNKRVDGYLNALQRPQVGTVFLVPVAATRCGSTDGPASWPTPTTSTR
jgi:predicted pyridoxine 5'-phosphate oxidase superfamily flavin-nucleotide-binding protein